MINKPNLPGTSFCKVNLFVRNLPIIIRKMKSFPQVLKDWMLPIAMTTGVASYLVFHFTPALHPIGPVCKVIASKGQQIFIGIMLFLQFVKVSPSNIRIRKWHLALLLFQAISFVALALSAAGMPDSILRILIESAMLCLICPTASASGVITDKLGGSLSQNMTYLVLINSLATVLIPAVIPVVHPSEGMTFLSSVWIIAKRIFPMLLLPCLLAWIIRYRFHHLQNWLSRYTHWAFYLWSVGLILAMILATRALVWSGLSWKALCLIGLVSVASCLIQFAFGHRCARKYGETERITAGQALGQKNTGFLIWLGYSFMTPVTAIAGGFYSIAHNVVNSWELYQKRIKTN